LDNNFLTGKNEQNSTQNDAASTNPSSFNLPSIPQACSQEDKKSKMNMVLNIDIDLIDSDDDVQPDDLSNCSSQGNAREIYTVIKKDNMVHSPMSYREKVKEKQMKELKLK